jgi:hypothetical protein
MMTPWVLPAYAENDNRMRAPKVDVSSLTAQRFDVHLRRR